MKITITQQDKTPVAYGGVGLLLEDVNYSLDGGLYAELLENRNFEAKDVQHGGVVDDGGYAWEVYPAGADATLKIKTDRPLFYENPHYLRLTANEAGAGVKNKAYDGIYLKAKTEYKISFYARSYNYKGTALVGVYAGGTPLFEKKVKLKPDGQWRRYAFHIKSKTDAERADFCFTLSKAGSIHLDCFSMMSADAIMGVFRRDLVTLLKEMEPGFLRFPDDCSEGKGGEHYLWKYSIGLAEHRKHAPNRWAGGGNSHYGQSLGIGYFEYFKLAEYLGAKPFPVVNVNLEDTAYDEESCLQDALDVIEFAAGSTNTMWGRVRAEMGHPDPFELEYLGVAFGACKAREKEKCKKMLEERIHEIYPKLCIVETGANTFGSPDELYEKANGLSREKAVAGGYAASLKNAPLSPEANRFECALAEAAFLTGLEQNADDPAMCYAPLLARVGYTQWSPALIWFDGNSVCPSASYYVQQLFSLHKGIFTLKAQSDEKAVYVSASERDAFTFVKVVNAGDETLEAEVEGDYDFGALTQIIRLSGELTDYNALHEPQKIKPERLAPTGERALTLAPHSFQVLVFKK